MKHAQQERDPSMSDRLKATIEKLRALNQQTRDMSAQLASDLKTNDRRRPLEPVRAGPPLPERRAHLQPSPAALGAPAPEVGDETGEERIHVPGMPALTPKERDELMNQGFAKRTQAIVEYRRRYSLIKAQLRTAHEQQRNGLRDIMEMEDQLRGPNAFFRPDPLRELVEAQRKVFASIGPELTVACDVKAGKRGDEDLDLTIVDRDGKVLRTFHAGRPSPTEAQALEQEVHAALAAMLEERGERWPALQELVELQTRILDARGFDPDDLRICIEAARTEMQTYDALITKHKDHMADADREKDESLKKIDEELEWLGAKLNLIPRKAPELAPEPPTLTVQRVTVRAPSLAGGEEE
jgi:hypothetical protein